MNYRSLFIALTLSFAFFSPVFAQDSSIYSRSGVYAGIGGVYAIEDFDFAQSSRIQNAAGFNFRLGYRFHPNMAIEAMGERVDPFDVDSFPGYELNTWTGTFNGKFFALTDRVQPYGLLGIGVMQAQGKGPGFRTDTETAMAFRYGGGIDFYLTEILVFNLETSYVAPTDDVRAFNYYTLGGGIQVRF